MYIPLLGGVEGRVEQVNEQRVSWGFVKVRVRCTLGEGEEEEEDEDVGGEQDEQR